MSDLNKSNDGKFLDLVGSALQSWEALSATVQCPFIITF